MSLYAKQKTKVISVEINFFICIEHVLRDIVYLHSLLDLIFAYTYNLFVSLFYFTIFQEKRIPLAINVCIYHILVIFFIEGCQYLIKNAHVAYTSKSTMFSCRIMAHRHCYCYLRSIYIHTPFKDSCKISVHWNMKTSLSIYCLFQFIMR